MNRDDVLWSDVKCGQIVVVNRLIAVIQLCHAVITSISISTSQLSRLHSKPFISSVGSS